MNTISFSRLGAHGRLGNQLFQVAAMIGMGERYKCRVALPEWEYERYFETSIPHGSMQANQVREKSFGYYDWNISRDCDLLGYFQSEKYFGSGRLRLKESFIDDIRASAAGILNKTTICIQVRRGDYVGNPNYYQLPAVFYLDSLLAHFPNWRECNLLFISDDIEYCRTQFEALPNSFFSKGRSDIDDMALASCCDHFIISNSTFGWWCAWLGEKEGTRIVHSGHLFDGRMEGTDTSDYWPDRWISNHKENYKIPLLDLTFTIPVKFDHPYRKENIELVVCLLQRDFESNYIIMEQGGDKFSDMARWSRYLPNDEKYFHRTKMLNEMAYMADTEFIANWDCDVIVPAAQIYMAIDRLRAGADMVYPYGGRFARMPRPWFGEIQKSLDIGTVRDTMFKGREADHFSVGGAVLFRKESFIEGGLENEKFISFGPEDCERYERFKALGYDIQRTGGSLFHFNHHVGDDSSPRNPHFQNNEKEFRKVKGMNEADLRAYINIWPWRHLYSNDYYGRIGGGSERSARIVLGALPFDCGDVIDIGCGVGTWGIGVQDYIGVDHRVRTEDLLILADRFIDCDLNKNFPSVGRRFDLCLCLEVAEHLRPERAQGLIHLLCSLSDRVLFSAAIPHQGGMGHVNERFQSYWGSLFWANGFGVASTQPAIRDNPDVELWYRQNIVLYERGARGVAKDFILPEYYIEIIKGIWNDKK